MTQRTNWLALGTKLRNASGPSDCVRLCSWFAALGLAVMTGCSTPYGLAKGDAVPKGNSLVYGSFKFESALDGGTPFFSQKIYSIRVVESRTLKNVLQHPVKGNGGDFYWHLPPGEYAILDLFSHKAGFVQGLTGVTPTTSHRIYSEFTVPNEPSRLYIGNIRLVDASGAVRMSVTDESQPAKGRVEAAFPKVNGPHVTQLVKPEVRR